MTRRVRRASAGRAARAWLVLASGLATASAAGATWSVVAVDPDTREVGAAGATCTVGVEHIHALVPGVGVVVAQARSNWSARDRAVELLRAGTAPAAVIDAIANPRFDPDRPWGSWQRRQYGVASLAPEPAVAAFTGAETDAWQGERAGGAVSVQGNLLRGPEVLERALEAFRGEVRRSADGCAPDLGERLVRALEAGAAAGGDRRCGERRAALTAFVAVARPGDDRRAPSLSLVAPRGFGLGGMALHLVWSWEPEAGSPPPVALLRERYEEWRRRNRRSLTGCAKGADPASGMR